MSRRGGGGGGGGDGSISSVFYADTYHPIQAGSIDGTDILPHDNGVYRALLCSKAALCIDFVFPINRGVELLGIRPSIDIVPHNFCR